MNTKSNYEHRTATKALKLVLADGSPVKSKEVLFTQTNHKFLFGCAGFDSVPLTNGYLNDEKKEETAASFRKFFKIFNYATLPFYWGRFESQQGAPATEQLKKAAQWLVSQGCTVKGHPLCWHTNTAEWLLIMNNADILATQLKRINREVTDFKGLIDIWDVINEVVIMPIFDKYDNGITRICKDLGRIRTVKEVFAAAKQANTAATLLINDFNTTTSYEILIEGCLEAGIPIDAIGIQSHMHQGYWGVEKTLKVLERFSHFNLPMHFTENTIVSGHLMPPEIEDLNDYQLDEWPTTPEGEDRQAREVIQHYKTLFAHPLVESITWWDFKDGQWLGAPSGLLRSDSSSKPVYEELQKLIKSEWWTAPTLLSTDELGYVTLSGYQGEYDITCVGKKSHFVLDKKEEPATIVMK
jgi:endo-1,4-beta-xylanase